MGIDDYLDEIEDAWLAGEITYQEACELAAEVDEGLEENW